MHPLAFTDHQLEVIFTVGSCVPPDLRDKYLKGIARRLPVDGNVDRAISTVLVKLDKIARRTSVRRGVAKRVANHKAREKAGFACSYVDYDGSVLDLAVRHGYLNDNETTDPKKVRAALSQMLLDPAHARQGNALACPHCGRPMIGA